MNLFLRNAPLLRVVIPFIAGLAFVFYFGVSKGLTFVFGTLCLACLGFLILFSNQWKNSRRNPLFGLISTLLFFSLAVLAGAKALKHQSDNLSTDFKYVATIETVPVEKERSFAVNLKINARGTDSTGFLPYSSNVVGYFHKDSFDESILPGESILFEGYFSDNEVQLFPNEFDYQQYLKRKGYQGTVYVPEGSFQRIDDTSFSLKAFLNRLRWHLVSRLKSYSSDEREFGVIAALVLGDRSFLDKELRSDFATAGAVHILAVSGLHVGIIYLLFSMLLDLLLKDRARLFKFIFILFILWAYAGLTGFSPSVLRAATMFSFISLGKYHKKHGSIYNMLAASALLLLIINPLLITQVGFQLSYLAVLGIVYYHPRFYELLVFQNWMLDKVWSLVCVSVAAQLATFPLSIYYFNQFPNLFLITNIIVIPLATLILYLGVAWVAFLWLPIVNDILAWCTLKVTYILNWLIGLVNTIPYAKTGDLYVSVLQVFLLYALIISVTAFFRKPRKWSLRLILSISIVLCGFHLHRHYMMDWNSKFVILRYENESVIIRLLDGHGEVYSKNLMTEERPLLERRIRSYLLSHGVSTDDLSYHMMDEELNSSPILNQDFTIKIKGDKVIVSMTDEMNQIDMSDRVFYEL